MAETKTKPSLKNVATFLGSVEGEQRRRDAAALASLMEKVTGESPTMWGETIVGFGRYHYKYASGTEGDSALVGFSPRKNEFSLYLTGTYFPGMEAKRDRLLSQLGKHRMGKSCLYVKTLADIDLDVLEKLVVMSVEALKAHYPDTSTTPT